MWDIAEALRTKQKEESELYTFLSVDLASTADTVVLPHMYLSIAQSCVSSLATGRVPPADSAGEPVYDQDPRFLVVGSWDGTATLLDMRDPGHPVLLQRQRCTYWPLDARCAAIRRREWLTISAEPDCRLVRSESIRNDVR